MFSYVCNLCDWEIPFQCILVRLCALSFVSHSKGKTYPPLNMLTDLLNVCASHCEYNRTVSVRRMAVKRCSRTACGGIVCRGLGAVTVRAQTFIKHVSISINLLVGLSAVCRISSGFPSIKKHRLNVHMHVHYITHISYETHSACALFSTQDRNTVFFSVQNFPFFCCLHSAIFYRHSALKHSRSHEHIFQSIIFCVATNYGTC